jgi:hypothetical protein
MREVPPGPPLSQSERGAVCGDVRDSKNQKKLAVIRRRRFGGERRKENGKKARLEMFKTMMGERLLCVNEALRSEKFKRTGKGRRR